MIVTIWQLLGFVTATCGLMFAFGVFCAWMVFKTKTISFPTPFFQAPAGFKRAAKPSSYASDLFDDKDDTLLDETLSSAAARLRSQRVMEDKASITAHVTGKKVA